MARPKSTELTSRELAVMQVFWKMGDATAEQVRQGLQEDGEAIAYVTVANVVRGLAERGFLDQTNDKRPFVYRPLRSFDDVSGHLIGDLVSRLFQGSREALLVQLLGQRKLSRRERAYLKEVLQQQTGSE